MSFSKGSGPLRKIMLCGAAGCVLLPLIGPSRAVMAAGNMGDPSAPMRRNAAAYPEFFASKPDPAPDPAPNWAKRCKIRPDSQRPI